MMCPIKIIYVLSFMLGGVAQVWATNKTNNVLSGTCTFSTISAPLTCIEKTFGDPDWEWTACTEMHALKMMAEMMADKDMAKFEILGKGQG